MNRINFLLKKKKPTRLSCFSFMYAWMLSRSVASNSFQHHGLQHARLLCSWDCQGKNTGVGCHAFLQGILPTQGLSPGLWHCRRFFTMWATREAPSFTWRRDRKIEICEPGRTLSPNTRPASTLTLDFPASRTVKINFYCFISHLIYGVVLQSRKKLRC